MHYINGREAKEGDAVIVKSLYGTKQVRAGVIHSLNAGAETCNGQVAVPIPGGIMQMSVTIGKEVLHAEDGWEVVGEGGA